MKYGFFGGPWRRFWGQLISRVALLPSKALNTLSIPIKLPLPTNSQAIPSSGDTAIVELANTNLLLFFLPERVSPPKVIFKLTSRIQLLEISFFFFSVSPSYSNGILSILMHVITFIICFWYLIYRSLLYFIRLTFNHSSCKRI